MLFSVCHSLTVLRLVGLRAQATYGTFKRVGDQQSLAAALVPYPQYKDIFVRAQEQNLTPVDVLYQMEVKLNTLAFDSQSQFAAFYAYTRSVLGQPRCCFCSCSCCCALTSFVLRWCTG